LTPENIIIMGQRDNFSDEKYGHKIGWGQSKKQINEKKRDNQNLVYKVHTFNQIPSAKRNNRSRFLKITVFVG
jgi:nicotinic acid phosphoribosyltransferase